MPKHILFVCQSCHRSSEELAENQLSDGSILLDKINNLCNKKFCPTNLRLNLLNAFGLVLKVVLSLYLALTSLPIYLLIFPHKKAPRRY